MSAALPALTSKIRFLFGNCAFQRSPLRVLGRLLEWRVRCLCQVGAVIELDAGVWLRLPPEWLGISKLLFAFRDDYETELIPLITRLQPGMYFADVGASLGVYSVLASKAVGECGAVLAFEPARRTFQLLSENIALNRLRNVRLWNIALADREDVAWLKHERDSGRNAIVATAERKRHGEQVRLECLDSLLEREGIPRLDVLKIDVEGAEALVLRGTRRSLQKYRPVVQFEINEQACQALGVSPWDAWNILAGLGYRFYSLHSDLRTIELSAPRQGNVLALPEERR